MKRKTKVQRAYIHEMRETDGGNVLVFNAWLAGYAAAMQDTRDQRRSLAALRLESRAMYEQRDLMAGQIAYLRDELGWLPPGLCADAL